MVCTKAKCSVSSYFRTTLQIATMMVGTPELQKPYFSQLLTVVCCDVESYNFLSILRTSWSGLEDWNESGKEKSKRKQNMYILKLKAVLEECTYESVAIFKSIASAPNSWLTSPLKGNMHGNV